MASLLVVDDEPRIRTLLNRSLSAQGHTVHEACDGQSALVQLTAQDVDLILLDLALPHHSGFDVLDILRERASHPPVIVITAATDTASTVQALEQGAVDVVVKPFSTAELAARIRGHLSPTTLVPAKRRPYLEAGGVRLDLRRRRALTKAGTATLSGREFALLAHLMRRSNLVCTRKELLFAVWGGGMDRDSKIVDVCVARLRWKLGPTAPIETVRGFGYCLVDEGRTPS